MLRGKPKDKKKSPTNPIPVNSSGPLEISPKPHPDPWGNVFKSSQVELSQFNFVENICKAKALAHAADARSPWTKGHSERVASYAVAIGEKMGLSSNEIKTLEIAGFMHDIGRSTYSAVLDKPAGITDEEFELVKKHPVRGAEIIKPLRQLHGISPAVKHHHERIDGKGYPDNLKGDDIPLSARIICVADSFDSMTTDRPYRPCRGKDYAIAELHKYTGSQFDSVVVQAFQSVLRERGGTLNEARIQ